MTDNKKDKEQESMSRRKFGKLLGLGGAAGAGMLMFGSNASANTTINPNSIDLDTGDKLNFDYGSGSYSMNANSSQEFALTAGGNDVFRVDTDFFNILYRNMDMNGNNIKNTNVNGVNPASHAGRHHAGGPDAIDAGKLDGSSGSAGQVLLSDGSNAYWGEDPSGEEVVYVEGQYTTSGETTVMAYPYSRNDISVLTATNNNINPDSASFESADFGEGGSKLFVCEFSGNAYQWSLSTPYDLSTATYNDVSLDLSGSGPRDIEFNNDGTKMYIIFSAEDYIKEYSLSTAWDLSTASGTGTTFTYQGDGHGLAFNQDGTKMYDVHQFDSKVYSYNLSTAWDLSTASSTGNSYNLNGSNSRDVDFNGEGTRMIEVDKGNSLLREYKLTKPYDITTASSTGTTTSISGDIKGGAFGNDGRKFLKVQLERIDGYTCTEDTVVTVSSSDVGTSGKKVRVVDKSGKASSYNIPVNTESNATINGQSSITLSNDYEAFTLQSDGVDWRIVSRMDGGGL